MLPTAVSESDGPTYLRIADFIEEQVASGRWEPNMRLAPTAELATQFAVSVPTIQRSLARLAGRGLLRRTPRVGTFVNATVASQTLGVVFGYNPFTSESHYYRLLYEELTRQAPKLGLRCRSYVDLEGDFYGQIRELERNITERGMLCLLALCRSPALNAWLEQQQLVPWISGTRADATLARQADAHCAAQAEQALLYCRERGYRRIGVLAGHGGGPHDRTTRATYVELFGADNLTDCWRQCAPTVRSGYDTTKAWLGGDGVRPEVVFSNHDIATRGALLAIMELGLDIPRDLGLITHANKGDTYPSPVPLTKIEVDPAGTARAMLATAKEGSRRQRVGLIETDVHCPPVLVPGASCGEEL